MDLIFKRTIHAKCKENNEKNSEAWKSIYIKMSYMSQDILKKKKKRSFDKGNW